MNWKPVSKASVEKFLDFGLGIRDGQSADIGRRQLEGTVALYNRLATRPVAWCADEVGMGKTYIALGVIALVRHLQPNARILVLVPTSRLQPKWAAEMVRFTRSVVRIVDHRARTLQDTPGREFKTPRNLHEIGNLATGSAVDILAPLSAFSLTLGKNPADWMGRWAELRRLAPTLPALEKASATTKDQFKRHYAAGLNSLLPSYDLVIVDESHNLKHGFSGPSARNQTLAVALGGVHAHLQSDIAALVKPKVGRLLCLSATPIESDYSQLVRQAELFGLGKSRGFDVLDDGSRSDDDRKVQAQQVVIRRLNRLSVGGRSLTKNLYRREWRQGGVGDYDTAMRAGSDLDRLVLALVQKRVTEVLHQKKARASDGTFLRSFQMGMLSSFESFLETVQGQLDRVPTLPVEGEGDEEAPSLFDNGDQTQDRDERMGLDTAAIDTLCSSFRERFLRGLPHPKLDQVAKAAAEWMAKGEKSLIFVRRIRTVEELAGKIARRYDDLLFTWLRTQLPASVADEFDRDIDVYTRTQGAAGGGPLADAGSDDEDEGSGGTFFAWYFRGKVRTGARFRKQQLQSPGSRWSILYHDNHVARLLGVGLAAWIAENLELVERDARYSSERDPTKWRHRYEAWQAGALEVLGSKGATPELRAEASWLRRRLYPASKARPADGDLGDPLVYLSEETLFTVIAGHPLGGELWPRSTACTEAAWLDRERRRELLASAIRLGHPNIDVWLAAVSLSGHLDGSGGNDHSAGDLARAFLARLVEDPSLPGWTRRELLDIGRHHDLILEQNFPRVPERDLWELDRAFQAGLSKQAPVLGMHGSQKSEQALKQFRMPGYPYVIVCTDILSEGVDLHTFCARVLHYGITHTSSGTEQRTGRIDRIASLVQRRLDQDLHEDGKLQVHYPHLLDTIEPLQVQVLYERMDRFVRLLHDGLGTATYEDSRIALDQSMRAEVRYPQPIKTELRSPFEVVPEDLVGMDHAFDAGLAAFGPADLERWLAETGQGIAFHYERARTGNAFLGEAWLRDGELVANRDGARRQPFRAAIESRADGRGLRLRIVSPIGTVDVWDTPTAGRVLNAAERVRNAVVFDTSDGEGTLAARTDVALEAWSNPAERLRDALTACLVAADALEKRLMGPEVDLPLAKVKDWLDPKEDKDDAR